MKSNWIVVLCLLACLMLPSCGPHMYKTMSSGTDDVAYVIVIKENTDRTSYDDVQLVIDGSTCFYGKVYKQKAKRKAPVVTVKPGGIGSPRFVISARLAPLPPRRLRMSAFPSLNK